MNLLISKELAQKMLDYLQKQPYVEVYELIEGLKTVKVPPFEIETPPTESNEVDQARPREIPE